MFNTATILTISTATELLCPYQFGWWSAAPTFATDPPSTIHHLQSVKADRLEVRETTTPTK